MRQAIPTRIHGANLVRHAAARRADGSAVLIRRATENEFDGGLPYEEIISANFAFTREPGFTLIPIDRSVRCLAGELYVVLIDVRSNSPTFARWQSFLLAGGDARTLSVPTGVAMGWQVISQSAKVEMRASCEVAESRWRWLTWNDPTLDLQWPELPSRIAHHQRASRDLKAIPSERLPRFSAEPGPTPHPPELKLQTKSSLDSLRQSSMSQETANQTLAPNAKRIRNVKAESERILVIGSSGQLGRDLCRELRSCGTVIGACRTRDKESVLPVPVFIDVSRPASLRQAIRQVRPTLIVNAASLTDIAKAESEPRLAQLINATAPAIIVDEARNLGAAIVHFCSGMVFDGSGARPWRECDVPNPLNQFARSKLIGTQAVTNSGVPHLILRSSWLYSSHGENYVRQMIDSLSYRSTLTLADDHFGAPTSTRWLAEIVAQVLKTGRAAAALGKSNVQDWLTENGGLYHASTLGSASKLAVGDQILATCRQHALPIVLQKLNGRPLAELPSNAKIPENCALDPSRLAMKFHIEIPRWQTQLNEQISLMLGDHQLALSNVA